MNINRIEERLIRGIEVNLALKEGGRWIEDDDTIFRPHSRYVPPAIRLGLAQRPIRLWVQFVEPRVRAVEALIGNHIHVGAPLYNTGLCYFVLGDYDRAAQYIAAAGDADRRLGGGASRLLLGGGLGKQVFIDPIESWLPREFGHDYLAGTNQVMDRAELEVLVSFLAPHPTDALVFLSALHRLKSQLLGPDNAASQLHRVRALADLLVVLESSLRRWQRLPVAWTRPAQRTLKPRCNHLVDGTPLHAPFHARDGTDSGLDWEDPSVVNAMLQDQFLRFSSVGGVAEGAGVSLYVSFRLRNALLHALDDQLSVYSQPPDFNRAVALALVAIRLSCYGSAGQLASL